MVIRLTTGSHIGGLIRYNEQKVVQQQACILATTGFANNDLAAKSREYATNVLEHQSEKNDRVTKPTLHFSLNLHPSEQVSDNKFKAIAATFMATMGYQDQPYIVYRHHDTAHPHIHIVTTCVDQRGRKIDDAFLKRRVNLVRQKLEKQYGLLQAEGRGKVPAMTVDATLAPVATAFEPGQEADTSGPLGTSQPAQSPVGEALPDQTQPDQTQPSEARPSEARLRKEQLELVLRGAFQASFTDMDQYKNLLAAGGVRTVLHQSTVAGKSMRGVSYQLTDEDGKAISPRIKASEIGHWATWSGIEKRFNKSPQQRPQPGPGDSIDPATYKILAAVLSDALRDHKKTERIYYESTLIENFPTVAMQTALTGAMQGKLTGDEVTEAVRRFEGYKRSQLPEIIRKEQFVFERTMTTYSQIGSTIRGSTASKRAFFAALSVDLDKGGNLTSPTNPHLRYRIPADRWAAVLADTGPDLKIPNEYSRGERTIMLVNAAGKTFQESYLDVRHTHLETVLTPESMQSVHRQLNQNYLTKLTSNAPVIGLEHTSYFYQRGLVIDPVAPPGRAKGEESAANFLVRFHQAPPSVAVVPGGILRKQIPYLDPAKQHRGLTTEAGQYMVALAQCLDRAAEGKNERSQLAFIRKRIRERDPSLSELSDKDLLVVLETRSQQGRGLLHERADPRREESGDSLTTEPQNAFTGLVDLLPEGDVFDALSSHEQTGKFKHIGKAAKKRTQSRGNSREL